MQSAEYALLRGMGFVPCLFMRFGSLLCILFGFLFSSKLYILSHFHALHPSHFQTNKQTNTMIRKDTNPSLHRMLSSTRSMHRHAVREQRKHRITEHSITNRTERNRRVLERRIAQTHILLAHVKSPHRRQLPQHQRASPVLLQFRHHYFNALD